MNFNLHPSAPPPEPHEVLASPDIPLAEILDYAAQGLTPEQVVEKIAGITLSDVYTALAYAADLVRQHTETRTPEADAQSLANEPDLQKILVVDDLEPNRRLVELMFRGTDFEIILAESGVAALELARAELPFLIISDIQMPEMSGYELCQQLKADEVTRNLALIFVTAHHRSVDNLTRGLDLGADDYIYRPFQRDELLARVRAVARLKVAEAEARSQARVTEQRNRELELLNKLALAVSSSQQLEQILPVSLQKLAQLIDAEAVALLVVDAQHSRLLVTVAQPEGTPILAPVNVASVEEGALQEQAPAILAAIDAEFALQLSRPTEAGLPHVRSVPMEGRERTLGILSIINKRGGELGVSDWVLLISATGLVTAAVENAWLWQSVQRQVEDLTLLNQVGQTLTSTLELEQILSDTTNLVQVSLDAELASLWLLDETGEHLTLTASSGPLAEQITGYCLPVSHGIAGYVARTGEPYASADVGHDERHYAGLDQSGDYEPGSILCVPLRIAGRVIGVVQALHSEPRWFSHSDLQLFESVTSSVGIAVENARLFAEVQEFNQQLENMVAESTQQLEREKEQTWAILASMADALVVLDTEQRILIANLVAEEMLAFRLAERVGQPLDAGMLAHPLWRCVDELARSDELSLSMAVDVSDPVKPDSVTSIQARSSKMWAESGEVVGTVIVLRDVTALKEVERMKARFMTGITHELKTPLAVIRMHANNLNTYYNRLPDRKRKELLEAIDKQVNLLERLVGDILELARMDAEEVTLERRDVDIGPLVEQVVADLRPLAQQKRQKLNWNRPRRALVVHADPGQMERVVTNLVENAIKYTEAGGSIEVEALAAMLNGQPQVGIRVTDSGIGIPPEALERVFERFYRVDSSHTTPGTGLGLAIVKEIVEAHHGQIQVGSILGEGSTFFVTLPGKEM